MADRDPELRPAIRGPAAPDLDRIAAAGALLWSIIQEARENIRPGVRTRVLGDLITNRIQAAGAEPVMLETGFPAAAAVCVNDEVVHAPPGARLIREGDLVTIDAALRLDGWCADAAVSVVAGNQSGPALRLAQTAERVLQAALAAIQPGVRWSRVARGAWEAAAREGCTLIREYASHGIGRELHEPPALPFLPPEAFKAADDPVLDRGMVLSVEPIVTLGRGEIYGDSDGWRALTVDRALACYEERTVAVIDHGCRVLTRPR